ncbi:hypothetical protein D3C73_1044420 [compost metagenome]
MRLARLSVPIRSCSALKLYSTACFSCATSKYQARMPLTWLIALPVSSPSCTLRASCHSGNEMRRANHQVISSDNTPSGMAFQITADISRDSGCSVASVGRCATMPQPVAATGA